MFDKFKDMYKLQKQAKSIKKELGNLHIEAEVEGVTVTISGEQEVISIVISEQAPQDKQKLGEIICKALNKAIKKSQEVAAERMKGVMGDMGLGNLMGKK